MISALLFICIALILFFYVVSPFFDGFRTIPRYEEEEEVKNYLISSIEEFEEDLKAGKISREEFDQIKYEIEKEMKNE